LHGEEKFCTEYGCQYVFHPVRDELMVRISQQSSHAREREIRVPLYGGPAMTASDDIEVLATYSGFTEKTDFLVDKKLAEQVLIGAVAAARKQYGKGMLYLFGPHFEHPHYTAANEFLFAGLYLTITPHVCQEHPAQDAYVSNDATIKTFIRTFKREISNSRIVAFALEQLPYQWLIGRKVYDPEKIRVFLETIWSRIQILEDSHVVPFLTEQELEFLQEQALKITGMVRQLKQTSASSEQDVNGAEQLFTCLRRLTATFLSVYFRLKCLQRQAKKTMSSSDEASLSAHA
jgi:hypothetical protein